MRGACGAAGGAAVVSDIEQCIRGISTGFCRHFRETGVSTGLYEQFGLAGNADNPLYAEKIPVTIRLVSPAGLVEGEVLHQMERAVNEQKIMEIPKQPPREAALKELVEERFAYQYPYEKENRFR